MNIFRDVWKSLFGHGSKKKQDASQQNLPSEERLENVALNGGEHGTIFGFNRNIIVGTGIGIFAITAIATIIAFDDDVSETVNRPTRHQQASTSVDGSQETAKFAANSYEDSYCWMHRFPCLHDSPAPA